MILLIVYTLMGDVIMICDVHYITGWVKTSIRTTELETGTKVNIGLACIILVMLFSVAWPYYLYYRIRNELRNL